MRLALGPDVRPPAHTGERRTRGSQATRSPASTRADSGFVEPPSVAGDHASKRIALAKPLSQRARLKSLGWRPHRAQRSSQSKAVHDEQQSALDISYTAQRCDHATRTVSRLCFCLNTP